MSIAIISLGSLTFVYKHPISGRVDRAFATKTVETGLIPGRVRKKL